MSGRVSLALVIHNHQPVGNFGWVIADVFEHAYEPLIDVLERHPSIHLGLHYTGPLLEWMQAERPEAIERIATLIDHGQVEIVGGGYYEPILISLPDRDRHGQLVRMADELERLFARRPVGAWLAERVWEPSLPHDLAAAGYQWTVVDDNHFRGASIPDEEMWTAFTTDDRGRRLTIFGTEMGLRYLIPFKPVPDLIAYLRERRTEDGRFVGMMGDDGEKFGSWPGTYEYCWSREHWVERLADAIEANSDWLSTVTPSEWLAGHPPTRRVYIPDASYLEMTEWALPPNETNVFTHLIDTAREKDLPEAHFLRGGFWRNFAARYREINDLHKQMLRTSELVAEMPDDAADGAADHAVDGAADHAVDGAADGRAKARATNHLYQGQSNDCYWHGLFGGIYIPHMRMATLSHLIAAEDIAEGCAAAPTHARPFDTDLDAVDEVLVTSPGQTIVVDPTEGAGISSWDLRATRVALGSVLRRRPEAYHGRLIEHERRAEAIVAAGEGAGGTGNGRSSGEDEAPRTIHDIVAVKEPDLAARLHYDRYERRNGLVHLLPLDATGEPVTTIRDFVTAQCEELGDFVDGPFELVSLDDSALVARRRGCLRGEDAPLVVTKTLRWDGSRLTPYLELEVAVENAGNSGVAFELAVEWNVNLLGGGHNPSAYYETRDGPDPLRTPHDSPGELPAATSLTFGNDYEAVRIAAHAGPAASMTWYPVETVSNSEAGFERVYQGSSLLFRWPVELAPGQTERRTVRFDVTQSVDRAAEEREGVRPVPSRE